MLNPMTRGRGHVLEFRYHRRVESSLILADRIVQVLKDAGTTKLEAQCAMHIALSVIQASEDIPILSQDEREHLQGFPSS